MLLSIKAEEARVAKTDRGICARMVQGVGGVRVKPPAGVPADALDLSGDGGLCKRILKQGDQSLGTPPEGSEVRVRYKATLVSDGTQFGALPDDLACFKLGAGTLIRGLEQGVATMHRGEKAELYCREDYGYGKSGHDFGAESVRVPGGATLKLEVELVEWGSALGGVSVSDAASPPLSPWDRVRTLRTPVVMGVGAMLTIPAVSLLVNLAVRSWR